MIVNQPTAAMILLVALLAARSLTAEVFTRYVNISGQVHSSQPEYVPHGDPLISGFGTLEFDTVAGTMDFDFQLADNRYQVTQAHIYELPPTGNPQFDSEFCWGGRWSSHDFLNGQGFVVNSARIASIKNNPENWFLSVHTEGGHFALDDDGFLVPYDGSPPQETSVGGVFESGSRFNNRVGRKLDDLLLREINPVSGSFPNSVYPDPNHFLRTSDAPFPDADGNAWIEPDGDGGFQPSLYGTLRGLTRADVNNNTYLFYRYDDQGPSWDFGGPEAAAGGFLFSPALTLDGDLNLDGMVDTADWSRLIDVYGSDLSGMTGEAAYLAGDLNADGQHTLADIEEFRTALLADVTPRSVPEPSTMASLFVGLLATSRSSVRPRWTPKTACDNERRSSG